jgi:lia operon protein LiaG
MKTIKPLGIAALLLAAIAVGSLGIAAIIAVTTGSFNLTAGPRDGTGIEERKSFPAGGIGRIAVESASFDVRVSDSPDGAVNVRLYSENRMADAEDAPYLVTDVSSGVLRVGTERRARLRFWFERIVIEIGLPSSYVGGLSIVTASGDVLVGDHRYSEASIKSTSGDISIGRLVCGSLGAETTSGDIKVNGVEVKKAALSTRSGNINVAAFAGDLDAHATSGDLSVAFTQGPGSSVIEGTSGDVRVTLPSSAGFALNARSSSGDIECSFPITMERPQNGRHTLQGTVGTPAAASLRIVTTSGDIRIGRKP